MYSVRLCDVLKGMVLVSMRSHVQCETVSDRKFSI